MTSRLPKHLFDAIAAARLAQEFVAGLSFDDYQASALVRSAVERQLEILGEACQRMALLEPAIRERIPEVGLAIGLRNRIIHGYDRVEHPIVWDTLHKDLPGLTDRPQAELDQAAPPASPA
jgi:uncharacterized protein with HEPN domain